MIWDFAAGVIIGGLTLGLLNRGLRFFGDPYQDGDEQNNNIKLGCWSLAISVAVMGLVIYKALNH